MTTMKKITLLMVTFLIGCQTNTSTELSLNNLFNDHMVLQQDTLVSFWGQATKGVKVNLHCSWGAQATTVADETGNWMVQLNTCLLYTSPSPRDRLLSRMPSSA